MRIAPREPSPTVAALALLPGIAVVLYYALDPGLRAWLGWHAAWLFLGFGVCVFLLVRALRRRHATLRFAPQHEPGRVRPDDVAGPLSPF